MLLVDMFLQITRKLLSFQNKVEPNVLESLLKQGLIFVERGIFLIYYLMDVRDLKLEFKVSTKILLEIQTEDIVSRPLKKLLHWQKIVHIKL